MKQATKIFAITVLVVFTVVGFGVGFLIGQGTVQPVYLEGVRNIEEGKPGDVDFSLFWSAWDTLSRRYVASEKLDYEKMTYGAIAGMVESLGDPHTIFLQPGEAKGFLEDVEGKFEGVGMEIGARDGVLKIVAPLEGTPAQKAGLRPGDVLITIAGQPAADMKSEEAVKLIRGPKGTKVTISVLREGWDAPKEFTIERGVIEVPALKWELHGAEGEKKVAYIRLYQFSEKAQTQFQKAVSERRIFACVARHCRMVFGKRPGCVDRRFCFGRRAGSGVQNAEKSCAFAVSCCGAYE
ncbi:MAG: PDZ domain-containing protein [Candidatus Wildermuthbacteria bacterium]|nr:PDZ domain-containing protein [Candidatus Wildermuthbacteria bacterium]